MRGCPRFTVGIGAVIGLSLLAATPSLAIKTKAVKVNCATAKLQKAIDSAAAGVPTTITVSGTCSELIEVSRGKTITLVGNGAAEIKPPSTSTSSTLIITRGDLTLTKMKITNSATAANMVLAIGNSSLYIYGSTLSGPLVEIPLEVGETSVAKVFNSVIQGGTLETLLVSSQSTLEIFGSPTVTGHFDSNVGYKTQITTPATFAAIGCEQGGNLVIRAEGAGRVSVNNTIGYGIYASQCNALVRNKTGSSASVQITASMNAVDATLSQMQIENMSLSSGGYCMSLNRSDARATGLTYAACSSGQTNVTNSSLDIY